MPRGCRSNSDTPSMSSRSLSSLEAAGCDMLRISAARWMFPSSQMAVSSISCRVFRRARMNQGVVVLIVSPFSSPSIYIQVSLRSNLGLVGYRYESHDAALETHPVFLGNRPAAGRLGCAGRRGGRLRRRIRVDV